MSGLLSLLLDMVLPVEGSDTIWIVLLMIIVRQNIDPEMDYL